MMILNAFLLLPLLLLVQVPAPSVGLAPPLRRPDFTAATTSCSTVSRACRTVNVSSRANLPTRGEQRPRGLRSAATSDDDGGGSSSGSADGSKDGSPGGGTSSSGGGPPVASSVWEKLALNFVPGPAAADSDAAAATTGVANGDEQPLLLPTNPEDLKQYVQTVTILRVGVPALLAGLSASLIYTPLSLAIADYINDSGVFSVVSQDSSQYIQNILTTCGLTFSILVGQTYYFMYQQTEAVHYALYEEVTVAKSLLEQVSLVSQGREDLYRRIITAIQRYVQDDLRMLQSDPAVLLSKRPMDDPLESVMYLTSVGEPSVVYDSVRSLRQARAHRLGALQRKLPEIQMVLLWSLAGVVLTTFPLLGAGAQTIGGMGILRVQSLYLSFIVFGITLTMGVIDELRKPAGGAYNVDAVLSVMIGGLEEELRGRLEGRYRSRIKPPPSSEDAVAEESGADPEEKEEKGGKKQSLGRRIAQKFKK